MTDHMREMIQQLMGSDPGAGSGSGLKFTDGQVCRNYLVGCCPHEVLAGTVSRNRFSRVDLGQCPKVHDPALKADYEKAVADGKQYYYDMDALTALERFFEDADRKMEIAKKKLEETQAELGDEAQEKAEVVLELNEKVGRVLAEAERLGEAGEVEESVKLMTELEGLNAQKAAAEQEYRACLPAGSYQQQKLRVCDECGAYLGIHDNDRRLADHFGGKLHMGFVFLREKLKGLQETVSERRNKPATVAPSNSSKDREIRDRDRDRDRGRSRDSRERDRARDKDRDKDRDSGRHSSSRGGRRRSRSRSRGKSSRDSDTRKRRHRSRSRSRDRKRDRKSEESKGKSDRKRSRSRDRVKDSKDRDSKSKESKEKSKESKETNDGTEKEQSPGQNCDKNETSKDANSDKQKENCDTTKADKTPDREEGETRYSDVD